MKINNFKNKNILITGATGSVGSALVFSLIKNYNFKVIRAMSNDENGLFELTQKLKSYNPNLTELMLKNKIRLIYGDIRSAERCMHVTSGIDIVIHAAALKQVPTAEYNPFEAVKTNIMGGQNVIDAAISKGVDKVIALSTDKAAAPINLYGATKLASDKLFIAANNYRGRNDIKFSVVRYGNVMGSRGSVIPFFLKQKEKGALPITDERMTRFNIILQEGVDFVLKCLEKMWGGEIFVPKIPSYKILDVAKAIAPDVRHKIVGIRPGEKLHEEMITETDALNSIEFEKYFVILPSTELWGIDKFRKESNSSEGKMCEFGFSYNSGTNEDFLTLDDLKELIQNHI